MGKTVRLKTFRIGVPAKRGEGLRIGVTQRHPRGIPNHRWKRDDYFGVRLPALAPSAKLLARFKRRIFDDAAVRRAFFDSDGRELLGNAESWQALELIAQIAAQAPISIGGFCADESRCHRLRLRQLMLEHRS